ncbi:MAG: Alpha-L-fucosidase [Paenibacillus sp.]|jgi:alpha-L-fucosidase|nr:Alpha-L-fucosidase [Paenibacillus sp.]
MDEQRQPAKPTPEQLRWHDMELGMFCHFGINTFTGREWGDGTDDPALFAPSELDARQWVRTAKQAGFRYFILTAKHHDGFCLWPTRTTDYSVTSSPWKEGKGDVVRDCADACKAEGIGFGIYVSPWDRHESCYADEKAYDDFYAEQLTELLTNYGPLTEVWFDGAGSEGRRYDWPRIMELVRLYQPEAMIFNMGAPTIRWVGNEDGVAPYPCWNTANSARTSMFTKDVLKWLPETSAWVPAECDVPIRKKRWFWRPDDEDRLRSLDELMDIYYRSVGHGTVLLLNVAPDPRGLFPEVDTARVIEFGDEVRRIFATPVAETSGEGEVVEMELGEKRTIDHVVLMEQIAQGERIVGYVLEARIGGEWAELVRGSAVGHKKIDRFAPVRTDRLRFRATEYSNTPLLRSFSAYFSSGGPR